MRIKHIILLTIFLLALSIAPNAMAQNTSHTNVFCLTAVDCSAQGAGCSVSEPDRLKLTALPNSDLTAGQNVYIAECVATPKGQTCTTGSADTIPDLEWDTIKNLEQQHDYKFIGLYDKNGVRTDQLANPIKATADKSIPQIEWKSTNSGNPLKIFIGLYSSSTPQSTKIQTASCPLIYKEPTGIVFDVATLEPIPDATVSIFQKIGSSFVPVDTPLLKQKYQTNEGGTYTLTFPEADYRIDTSHPQYDQKISTSEVAPQLAALYSSASSSAYLSASTSAKPHADLGLHPKPGTLGFNNIALISNLQYLDESTADHIIKGIVSHPFTTIQIFTVSILDDSQLRILPNVVKSDKYGYFSTTIHQSEYESNEQVGGLILTKSDLFSPNSPSGTLQSTRIQINPIPVAISGYAYDTKGKPIPHAIVRIKFPFAQASLYETTADEDGYFSIPAGYLPQFPYNIQYENGDAITEITTSAFIQQNAAFIKLSSLNSIFFTPQNPSEKSATTSSAIAPEVPFSYTFVRPVDKHPYIFWSVVASTLILGIGSTIAGASLMKKTHHHHA